MGVIAVKKLLDELQKELSTCAGGDSDSYSKIQHFIENIQKVCFLYFINLNLSKQLTKGNTLYTDFILNY